MRRDLIAGLAVLLLMPWAALAQDSSVPSDPPTGVPFRWGPLALAPTLTLTNMGWDSNVLLRHTDAEPTGDVTATLRPQVRSWLRAGPMRLRARNRLDLVHFRDHVSARSLDGFHSLQVEVPLVRLTPYVSGSWVNTRQRFAFEIDEWTRRHERGAQAGVDVRVGLRTSVDVSAYQRGVEFTAGDGLRDPLLTDYHDYTSKGGSVAVRHELTPVTTAALTVSRSRDRFDLVSERDSDSLAIGSSVDFNPAGVVQGRLYVGWFRLTLVEPGGPSFGGLSAAVDLSYTLLGATRISVQGQRDISYSAVRGQHAYLLAGGRLMVNHRLGDTWDVGGRLGRYRLSYGLFGVARDTEDLTSQIGAHRDAIIDLGGEIGYRVGPSLRIAFEVGRQHRGSTLAEGRAYERMRAGLSVSYRF